MHTSILLNKDLGYIHTLDAPRTGETYRDTVSIGVSRFQNNNLQKQNKSRRQL